MLDVGFRFGPPWTESKKRRQVSPDTVFDFHRSLRSELHAVSMNQSTAERPEKPSSSMMTHVSHLNTDICLQKQSWKHHYSDDSEDVLRLNADGHRCTRWSKQEKMIQLKGFFFYKYGIVILCGATYIERNQAHWLLLCCQRAHFLVWTNQPRRKNVCYENNTFQEEARWN